MTKSQTLVTMESSKKDLVKKAWICVFKWRENGIA